MFGENIGSLIALPSARGLYVHVPLIFLAALIALRDKSVSLVVLTSCCNCRVFDCDCPLYLWL